VRIFVYGFERTTVMMTMMGGSKDGAFRSSGEVEVEAAFIGVGCNRVVGAVAWGPCNLVAFAAHHVVAIFSPQVFFSLPYCQLLAYTFSLVRFSGWYVNKSLIAELGLERKRERERGMKEMVLGIMTAQ